MKIIGPTTALPNAGSTGVPARASKSVDVAATKATAQATGGNYSGRPIRINRSDEEAALFAYTKQADLNLQQPKPQVDEYV
jgi:hypothetical protein